MCNKIKGGLEMKRYHKDIYFPITLNFSKFWDNIPLLTYSAHFLKRLGERYRKHIPQINLATAKRGDVFEVYAENNNIEKLGIRIRVNKFKYNCYIISKDGNVLTAWTTHKPGILCNMDTSLYEKRCIK